MPIIRLLHELGAEHVLDSSAPDFDSRLRHECHRLESSIGFDAVAGEMSERIVRAQPAGSRLIVYGMLSDAPIQIGAASLIFERKSVEGLYLTDWMRDRNLFGQMRVANRVQRLLSSDLRSDIQARYPLQHVSRALEDYGAHMTSGKVLLTMSEGS